MTYTTPLGEETVQESASNAGQFYKSNDPANAYYKVFDSYVRNVRFLLK